MKPSRELAKREPELTALEKPIEAIPRTYNYGVDPNAENEVRLLDYWRAIRKRLWLVISVMALLTMLSVVYEARKPDLFDAQARVQVDLENNSALVGKQPYFIGPSNDPVSAMLRAARMKAPHATRARAAPTEMRRTPRSASRDSDSAGSGLDTRTLTGFGETSCTIAVI